MLFNGSNNLLFGVTFLHSEFSNGSQFNENLIEVIQPNVQLIIGYRGMIDLARRSGQIVSISARTVRESDQFNYCYELDERLEHVPSGNEDAPISHVYAVARLKDGGVQFEVMTLKQIEAVRSQSKAANSGPWISHFEEMAKKTLIRRLFKYLPVSIESQRAVLLMNKQKQDCHKIMKQFLMLTLR